MPLRKTFVGVQVGPCTRKISQGHHCKNGWFSAKIHFCLRVNIAILLMVFRHFSISGQLIVNFLLNKYYQLINKSQAGHIGEEYTALAILIS